MNSGVPGLRRSGGPPFQAYQYVRRVPSASLLVTELMPLTSIRMFGNPVVEVVGLFSVGLAGDDNDGAVGLDLVARDLDASPAYLLSHAGERRLALAALARGFLRGRALDVVGLRLGARCPPLRLPFLMLAALLREPSGEPFVGRLVGGIPPAGSHCLGKASLQGGDGVVVDPLAIVEMAHGI